MKKILPLITGICLLTGFTTLNSCKEEEMFGPVSARDVPSISAMNKPSLSTAAITIFTETSAIVYTNIEGTGNEQVTETGICYGTAIDPLISDNHVAVETSGSGVFTCNLTNLTPGTKYFIRAYVSGYLTKDYNGEVTVYGNNVTFTTRESKTPSLSPVIYNPDLNPDLSWGSVSDIDGNIYRTVQIGNQTWMAENLKTTRYNDGSLIPNITEDADWIALETGACRIYNNNFSYKNKYGALYNWYAVKTGKLCPMDWHVPSDEEWKQLEMTLGMSKDQADGYWSIKDVDHEFYGIMGRGTDQGTQMRTASGWNIWEGRYGNGTNISGFSGLPGGDTDWYGKFEIEGQCGSWWSSTGAIGRALGSGDPGVIRAVYYAHTGFSVRCLKDN